MNTLHPILFLKEDRTMPVKDSLFITRPTQGQTFTAGPTSMATVVVAGNCGSTSAVSVTIQNSTGSNSVSEAKTVQPTGPSWTAAGFTLVSGQNYTVSACNGNVSDSKTITVV
jgi:hypothetical protein